MRRGRAASRCAPGGERDWGEGPGVDRPSALHRATSHAGHEVAAVSVVADEDGALYPPHHDVVECVWGIQAGLAGHGGGEANTT